MYPKRLFRMSEFKLLKQDFFIKSQKIFYEGRNEFLINSKFEYLGSFFIIWTFTTLFNKILEQKLVLAKA